MNETNKKLPEVAEEQAPQHAPLSVEQPVSVPQYRRDLHPTNLVLSANDLKEFCELLAEVNERAKEIEYSRLNLSNFESAEIARQRVKEAMPIEYDYRARNGDSVKGLGIPRTEERAFPEDLRSLFASNSTFAQRALNIRPLNTVDAFISFEKPSLKLDLQTFPSNPTENRSVINVEGRDEDWVISTAQKIESFFKNRKATRPIIHGSGAYDYIIYFVYLPAVIWLFYKYANGLIAWLEQQPVFLNVILGLYGFLLPLLFARFLFQYARWLFPPMEYYKRSRWPAFIHRAVAGFAAAAVGAGATYDLAKAMWSALFH